jgi:N-hydroxyarylamine O-acetyltransferase
VAFSLDAYLGRIGWTGSREPTLATLAGVLRAHMSTVPFENLDVLLGRSIRLDLDSLYAKLVVARRGGYCFEHGTLFKAALGALGFAPVAHAARVLMFVPRAEAPRTHMFLAVPVGGTTVVVDPGFGGYAAAVPVPLAAGEEVEDGGSVHRFVRQNGEWVLEACVEGAMRPLWSSAFEPAYPVDFLAANHFVSTYPESRFVTSLMLRALTPEGHVSAFNRDLTLWHAGREEKREIADRRELRGLLAKHFGFDLPEVERMRVPAVPEWR